MKTKIHVSIVLVLGAFQLALGQQSFSPRGVGGGGALFAPSINPANSQEFYVGCDMSELFHSTNNGLSYEIIHFQELQGGHNSKVRFTNNPSIRYCIGYANDQAIPMKSTNQGSSWSNLAGNPDPSEEAFFLDVDYANPNRIILAYYGSIYFSSDGGNAFNLIHTAINNGSGVLIGGAFFDGNTIYIGTNDGLLVSTNGGISFSPVNTNGIIPGQVIYSFAGAKQNNITRFFCLTADANDVYVGLPASDYWGLNQGVYSMDYGSGSWIPKTTGINPGTDFPMFVAMAENDISTAYLAGSNSSSEPDIFKTTNAGTIWNHVFNTSTNQNIASGWCGSNGDRTWSYAECPFGFAVAPNNPDVIIFSDYGFVHRSVNGGSTWLQAYLSPSDQNNPGSNTPVGKSYHSCGLENTTCWQVHWVNQSVLFACFSDIKGCRSNDGGQSWNFNYSGHSQNTMYRLTQHPNGKLYAATSTVHDVYQSTRLQDNLLDAAAADGKIIFSSDNGSTWNDLHDFSHPVFWVALDPNQTNRMYASVINYSQGVGGIYRSDDIQNGPASTWSKLPDPPRTEGHPACLVVLNDGKLVCSYSGRRNPGGAFTNSSGIFIYNPISNSWNDVSDNGMHYWTKDIVIDPVDPSQNTWYVGVFNGWGGPPNGLGGLYKTTNRGQSWSRVYNGSSVTSITFRPGFTNEAFVTTETNGLLYSTNMNIPNPSFQPVQAYRFRQPERVFFNPYQPNEMWVSSFGYGLEMTNLSTSGTGLVSFSNSDVSIYPNPGRGFFSLELPEGNDRIWTVEVRNQEGLFLAKLTLPDKHKIDLKRFGKGVYLLTLSDGLSKWVKKVIIL